MKDQLHVRHTKLHMRSQIKKRKRLFYITKETSTICRKILLNTHVSAARSVLVYVSYGSEVPTHELISVLLRQGKDVFVPKIIDKKMFAVRIYKQSELRTSKKAIPEPISQEISVGKLDLVIAPGVAFDRSGRRLGQGSGYYDKFFAQYDQTHDGLSYLLGLCWQWQIVPRVPVHSHDITMDEVVVL